MIMAFWVVFRGIGPSFCILLRFRYSNSPHISLYELSKAISSRRTLELHASGEEGKTRPTERAVDLWCGVHLLS